MATREGARTLGLGGEIGSIETGKRADLILVDRDRAHLAPDADPWSSLVYAARGTDVRMTMVDGEILVDGFALSRLDGAAIVSEAKHASREVAQRAGTSLGDTQG
jgi:5-methylthioadenosine/S-adenosylhomocysteine deaminase